MSEVVFLGRNHPAVEYLCKKDKRISKVIEMVGEIYYEPYESEGFSFLIHEIIEQMLSLSAGAKIYGRLENLCDGLVSVEAIEKLSDEEIKSIGTSNAKVTYIRNVTNAVLSGELDLASLDEFDDQEVLKRLTSIKGVGTWTAKMYLIFVLNRQDILPIEDAAFLQSYKWIYETNDIAIQSIIKKCQKWKPYSSIAARYLYRALDMGLTKTPLKK